MPVNRKTPPAHLAADGRRFWREVADEYGETWEEYEWQLLRLACEALDRGAQARRALRRHGLTYLSPQGSPVARPEVAIEKSSRTAFGQLVRQLGLGEADDDHAGPPLPPQPAAGRVRPYSVRRRRGEFKKAKGANHE